MQDLAAPRNPAARPLMHVTEQHGSTGGPSAPDAHLCLPPLRVVHAQTWRER